MNDTTPRQCFWIPPDQHDENGWIPSLVTEGQPGHAPFTGNGRLARPWYWGKTLAEAQATAERENLGTFGLSPDEALAIVLSSIRVDSQPFATQVRDASIRVYNQEPGTDDASDMYVMEVLGVIMRVRLVTVEGPDDDPDRTEPSISIEADGRFAVDVNGDETTYGDGS